MDLKLYVIKGQENAGKTSTCWMLLNKMKEYIDHVSYWDMKCTDGVYFDNQRQLYLNKKGYACDFVIIITTKRTKTKIAIISAGDENWQLRDDIFFMLKKEVKHIVCCSRNINRKNSTYRMLEYYFKDYIYYKSKEMIFNSDVIIRQKKEEQISQEIYEQLKLL